MCFKCKFVWVKVTSSLLSNFVSFGHLRFYLRYSSSKMLSRLSSSSLPSSSGRSPHSSRFCPMKDTIILVIIHITGVEIDLTRSGRASQTCCIQSIDGWHSLTVKHPEVSIVAGEQAGLTRSNHVISHNIPTECAEIARKTDKNTQF